MTLIEVLISVAIVALLATVIAAAITVVLRQAPMTTARVDLARWEQNLGTWLPADLTSADWPAPDDPDGSVDAPNYEPCSDIDSICDFGDNVAHLSWNEGGSVDVSYRYGPVAGGSYEFRRVACRNGGCSSITLVRDMPPPSADGETPITVTFPPDVLSIAPNGSEIINSGGRRVTVRVDNAAGTGVLTFAGGVERVDLPPAAIQPPEFLQARSGCGGPVTLIVDESGSLSGAIGDVRAGVTSFVEAFAGTPTQLQVVAFDADARVLDDDPADAAPEPWSHWFDLSDQATVDLLLGPSSPILDIASGGGTNWEDALYRAFHTESGQTYDAVANPAMPPSELVVFFTDGVPTSDRDTAGGGQTGAESPEVSSVPNRFDAPGRRRSGISQFSPRAWYRAQWHLLQTSTDVIGVGVGPGFGNDVDMVRNTRLDVKIVNAEWSTRKVPAEVLLGDLIAGNDPSDFTGTSSDRYVKVEFDGGWDAEAVKNADILTTTDFTQFGGALESIALAECGGTLTVQTRRGSDGSAISPAVTYEISGADRSVAESTTSAINKSAVFDIATGDRARAKVLLQPRTLEGTGFVADRWACRSRNVEITDPARMSEADPGTGSIGGVNVTVGANEAVSCVLFVEPE